MTNPTALGEWQQAITAFTLFSGEPRLLDRRCPVEIALAKLARLRRRAQQFTVISKTLRTLFTANVDKTLTFLNDRLLASTSNAVEHANRRHRKM